MKKATPEPKVPKDTTLYHPKLGAVSMTAAQAEKVMKINRRGHWSRSPINEDTGGEAETAAPPAPPIDDQVTEPKSSNGPRGNTTKGKAESPNQESGNSTGNTPRGED